MAMKPCKECGKEISTAAKACPHCGAPSTAEAVSSAGTKMIGVGCLLTLLTIPAVLILLMLLG